MSERTRVTPDIKDDLPSAYEDEAAISPYKPDDRPLVIVEWDYYGAPRFHVAQGDVQVVSVDLSRIMSEEDIGWLREQRATVASFPDFPGRKDLLTDIDAAIADAESDPYTFLD